MLKAKVRGDEMRVAKQFLRAPQFPARQLHGFRRF
jgi:hypothetical protein